MCVPRGTIAVILCCVIVTWSRILREASDRASERPSTSDCMESSWASASAILGEKEANITYSYLSKVKEFFVE